MNEQPKSESGSMKETFVREAIIPQDTSFSVSPMTTGKPGLPRRFSWNGKSFAVTGVLKAWKESGVCPGAPGFPACVR
jgi:hypothetical protein